MKYSILITEKAKRDVNEAADYIEYVLFNPEAADDLLDEVERSLNKLSHMPDKYKVVNDPVLASWGIRMKVINNYIAFYVVDVNSKTVTIIRFLYGKRNWISVLSNDMTSPDWTVEIPQKPGK